MKKKFLLIVFLLIVFSFSNYVFAEDINDIDINSLKEVIQIINQNYKDDIDNEQLVEKAIKGILNSLDSHSTYLKEEDYNRMLESLDGGFSGIGVNVNKINKFIQIVGVIKGSPAEKAGLKIGDKFVSIDGKSVIDMSTDEFIAIARGPRGTTIKVSIIRKSTEKPLGFEITRDIINIDSVEYKILNKDIGYIRIYEFNNNTSRKVEEALESFDKDNICKVIVDLRGNPGGYLGEVVDMAKYFIPKGPIVHIKSKNKPKQSYNSSLTELKYRLAVLVDGGSASASEVFAGAVQDTKAGTIIGTKTFGKGTVQTFYKLKDGNYIKLTIANYLTPNERMIDGTGLTPDIIIDNIGISQFDTLEPVRNIYIGAKGQDVFAVEQRLKALGYISTADDHYDNETRKVIISFKKDQKISPSGIITKQFQNVLNDIVTKTFDYDSQLEKAIEVLSK